MNEIKVMHKEYTLTREELLEKLGIKGEVLVDIDMLRLEDNLVMLKTKPEGD